MKTLFFILIAIVPTITFAQIEVPAQFVDSKIVTTLANGKTYSFDGNEYMVVKRKAKVVVAVPAEKEICTRNQVTSNHYVQKLNRVRLIAGYGPDGFKTSRSTGYAKVSTDNSVLGGVGYDRMVNKTISVGGLILSNGSLGGSIGVDF